MAGDINHPCCFVISINNQHVIKLWLWLRVMAKIPSYSNIQCTPVTVLNKRNPNAISLLPFVSLIRVVSFSTNAMAWLLTPGNSVYLSPPVSCYYGFSCWAHENNQIFMTPIRMRKDPSPVLFRSSSQCHHGLAAEAICSIFFSPHQDLVSTWPLAPWAAEETGWTRAVYTILYFFSALSSDRIFSPISPAEIYHCLPTRIGFWSI